MVLVRSLAGKAEGIVLGGVKQKWGRGRIEGVRPLAPGSGTHIDLHTWIQEGEREGSTPRGTWARDKRPSFGDAPRQ